MTRSNPPATEIPATESWRASATEILRPENPAFCAEANECSETVVHLQVGEGFAHAASDQRPPSHKNADEDMDEGAGDVTTDQHETVRPCRAPGCHLTISATRAYCAPHRRQADAWLKEQRRLDDIGMQGLHAVATSEDWADWDWNDPFSVKPGEFGDASRIEPLTTGHALPRLDWRDDDDPDDDA